jgi:TetR/AcrR family transcriptional repressor of mexCD-oprJ operon
MSAPVPRHSLQQRVSAAILEGAAHVFAVHGDGASMTEVAQAAGVARATLYRYFPSREALLDELARAALGDVERRLAAARIDAVAPDEGVARAVRALVEVGDPLVLLARRRPWVEPEAIQRSLSDPLRGLFERAQDERAVRDDIASARLAESLIGLVVGALTSSPPLGREDMTATVTGLFLDGARARAPRAA